MAPNRLTAYREARAAAGTPKGLSYSELLLDNIIGLDNDYLSSGEQLAKAFNEDELGFLKNAAVGAYEGAVDAVSDPIGAGEDLLYGIYDSVSNLATEDLDARLKRMYGVGFEEASDDQVNKAREAVFGDAMTASSLIPGAAGIRGIERAVDRAQSAAADRLVESIRPEYSPEVAAGARFYMPSRAESYNMMVAGPSASEQLFLDQDTQARQMLLGGVDPQTVAETTRMLPVPLRTTTGVDEGYRLLMAAEPEDFTAFRPQSAYNTEVFDDPELAGTSMHGFFRGSEAPGATERDLQIALNPSDSGAQRASTLTHEMTHGDLYESDIGYDESGANAKTTFDDQVKTLDILDEMIGDTTDVIEKAELTKLRDELSEMTSFELYSRNPGEMLARLSQGDATMAKRLTATQLLNPYINASGLLSRAFDAARTAALSERRPYMRALKRKYPSLSGYDIHLDVPMDMNKALLSNPSYYPQNPEGVLSPDAIWDTIDDIPPSFPDYGPDDDIPFAKGGIVKGSYLDFDPYD